MVLVLVVVWVGVGLQRHALAVDIDHDLELVRARILAVDLVVVVEGTGPNIVDVQRADLVLPDYKSVGIRRANRVGVNPLRVADYRTDDA